MSVKTNVSITPSPSLLNLPNESKALLLGRLKEEARTQEGCVLLLLFLPLLFLSIICEVNGFLVVYCPPPSKGKPPVALFHSYFV